MFTLFKKRNSYIHEAKKDKPAHGAPSVNDGGEDHAGLAAHHKKLAEHHHAISEEHAKYAGFGEVKDKLEKPADEAVVPGVDGLEEESPEHEAGESPEFEASEDSERPPDTIESAKYGPVEEESEESPEHEAGESKEVEAIEESRKPSLGLGASAGGSLRNSDHKRKPLSHGGRSFRPFGKGSSFKP